MTSVKYSKLQSTQRDGSARIKIRDRGPIPLALLEDEARRQSLVAPYAGDDRRPSQPSGQSDA